jgi:predicted ArsR family transcriptional regulator
MNAKETILALLHDADLTVPQIATKVGIDENNARVYVNRLRNEGKIHEISKNGKAKVYTIVKTKQATIELALQAENAALKDGARELYQAFLKIAENPRESISILKSINIEKIDGAVKYL